MSPEVRRLVIVTTTRADWGILSPLARALNLRDDVELTIAAGNMHLSEKYGNTINEILIDGFSNVVRVGSSEVDLSAKSRTLLTADIAADTARLIERMRPHGIILLGDRYEMLGVATAALIANVPVVHLHGGEISEGAIDDSVRHALTKMASLHLVATAKSAQRVIGMGEEPCRVIHTGALGVENALRVETMTKPELEASLDGFEIDPFRTLLVTFHPVTRHPSGLSTSAQFDNLLRALDQVEECNIIFTYPNNDTGSDEIINGISRYSAEHPERVKVVASLGKRRYLSALKYVLAVVGNTSSGLLEAPSTQASTIDIGPRQQGRERAESVFHVEDDPEMIAQAIRQTMAAKRNHSPHPETNPYYRPNALTTAVKAITEILPKLPLTKKFHA